VGNTLTAWSSYNFICCGFNFYPWIFELIELLRVFDIGSIGIIFTLKLAHKHDGSNIGNFVFYIAD